MPPRIRILFSTLSLTMFLVAAIPILTEFLRRSDIWWTPRTMLVPLAESADRVELFVRGVPVAATEQSDYALRFNNRDRLRAERLPMLLVSAAGCGFTACLFLLVVMGRLAYRPEREPAQ